MISNLNDINVDIDRGVQHDVHVLGSIGLILESQYGNPYPATSQSFWYFASSQAPGRWWFLKEKKNRSSPRLPLLVRQRRRSYWVVYSFVSVSARFHHDPGHFSKITFSKWSPPTKWHSIWHIFWQYIWHSFWHLPDILSGILSGILSNIYSDNYFIWHSIWHSILRPVYL